MYTALSKEFSLDFTTKPELLEQPEMAMFSAAWIWDKVKHCNELADKSLIGEVFHSAERVTRAINGGKNGLKERQELFDRAWGVVN